MTIFLHQDYSICYSPARDGWFALRESKRTTIYHHCAELLLALDHGTVMWVSVG